MDAEKKREYIILMEKLKLENLYCGEISPLRPPSKRKKKRIKRIKRKESKNRKYHSRKNKSSSVKKSRVESIVRPRNITLSVEKKVIVEAISDNKEIKVDKEVVADKEIVFKKEIEVNDREIIPKEDIEHIGPHELWTQLQLLQAENKLLKRERQTKLECMQSSLTPLEKEEIKFNLNCIYASEKINNQQPFTSSDDETTEH